MSEDKHQGTQRIHCTPVVLTFPAPEYEDVARWGIEQWTAEEIERLFTEMERDGINLILPTTGTGDKVWYPSRILQPQAECDWVGRLFDLAAEHGMEVILSGIPYTYHLQFQGQAWDPQADLEMNQRICAELYELYGQRPNFWGWYIPHETGDRVHRGDVMTILRALPPFLKTLTPDRPVAHSPWFTSHLTVGQDATTPAEFAAEWDAMLQEIEGLDVLAIQDSTAPFDEIGDWFEAVAPVCAQHHVELWSVVELFPRDHRTGYPDMTRAISFADLRAKMAAAAPYVQDYACWEYQNYLNPHSPLQGARETSAAYRAYYEADP
ncbi:MAG TPA: DUF4434 domain-containing protein [Chloroflexi bacterium]|nr:DUF4434 domain-containing protein [Chloroflexota bacterium]